MPFRIENHGVRVEGYFLRMSNQRTIDIYGIQYWYVQNSAETVEQHASRVDEIQVFQRRLVAMERERDEQRM